MNYKQDIRAICFSFQKEVQEADTVSKRYLLLYSVVAKVREEMRELHPKICKRDWMYEVAKVMGCTTQTLYRARAAVRSFKYSDREPSKYCQYSYNTMRRQVLGEKRVLNKIKKESHE